MTVQLFVLNILVQRMKCSQHGDNGNGNVAKTGDKSSMNCCIIEI